MQVCESQQMTPRFSMMPYPPRYGQYQREQEQANLEMEKEVAVLKEWGQIQRSFLNSSFLASTSQVSSWRKKIEEAVIQSTNGNAHIWWEPLSRKSVLESGQLIEVRHQQTRYGMLKLAPGYLVSHLIPDIPQAFGHLCALLVSLTEHQTLVASLQKSLEPQYTYDSLTPREKDVLQGMAFGENENAMAEQLHIALTTVRTHRHKVYQRLGVHSPQEAVLRSFTLRLLDWLDLSCNDRFATLHRSSCQKTRKKI